MLFLSDGSDGAVKLNILPGGIAQTLFGANNFR
jgi:hypothetical protein